MHERGGVPQLDIYPAIYPTCNSVPMKSESNIFLTALSEILTPFPWAGMVSNGSAKAECQLSGWWDPFPWTDIDLKLSGFGILPSTHNLYI